MEGSRFHFSVSIGLNILNSNRAEKDLFLVLVGNHSPSANMKQPGPRDTGDTTNSNSTSSGVVRKSNDQKTSWVDVVKRGRGMKQVTDISKKVNKKILRELILSK